MKANCSTCAYWLKQTPQQGLCRRYPPTTHLVAAGRASSIALPGIPNAGQQMQVQVETMFPTMAAHGWCGEHPHMDGEYRGFVDAELTPTQ